MNPCTIMGGFWFEMGRCLFGLTIVGGIIGSIFAAFFIYAAVGSISQWLKTRL